MSMVERGYEQLLRVGTAYKTWELAKLVIPSWKFKDAVDVIFKNELRWRALREANKTSLVYEELDPEQFDELCVFICEEMEKLRKTDCSIEWLRSRYLVIAERIKESEGFEKLKNEYLLDEITICGVTVTKVLSGEEMNPWKKYAAELEAAENNTQNF